jgi:DNA-binding HxlR family transcriptional regulator
VKTYGQFCPVAMASEVLGERWTVLVVRELLTGSYRFNDLRRGVPRMSPSLLVQRLRALERAGIVVHVRGESGGSEYHLTGAGEELRPLVEAMGMWGERWVRSDLRKEHLDTRLLMWDVRRTLDPQRLPLERLVVKFSFTDGPPADRRYWLVVEHGDVSLCVDDPGGEADLEVCATVRALTAVWVGRIALDRALREESITLLGAPARRREFRRWFGVSALTQMMRGW